MWLVCALFITYLTKDGGILRGLLEGQLSKGVGRLLSRRQLMMLIRHIFHRKFCNTVRNYFRYNDLGEHSRSLEMQVQAFLGLVVLG